MFLSLSLSDIRLFRPSKGYPILLWPVVCLFVFFSRQIMFYGLFSQNTIDSFVESKIHLHFAGITKLFTVFQWRVDGRWIEIDWRRRGSSSRCDDGASGVCQGMARRDFVASVQSQKVVDGVLHLGFDIFIVDDAILAIHPTESLQPFKKPIL